MSISIPLAQCVTICVCGVTPGPAAHEIIVLKDQSQGKQVPEA